MSNNYGYIERRIGLLLRQFPFIRKYLKSMYQRTNFLIAPKKEIDYNRFIIKKIDYKNQETFFGYYDKSPVNISGDYILYHATEFDTSSKPRSDKPVQVVLREYRTDKIIKTFESFAYNWQQGCRSHWIDNERFIYNDFDKERNIYVSKIVDTNKSMRVSTIDFPIYDTFGSYALGLNYGRLAHYRPDYGYRNLPFNEFVKNEEDGIFKIDLDNNKVDLIISLEELASTLDLPKDIKEHKVNHIMISPKGEKFIFLYRYFIKGRKFDCLFCYDFGKSKLVLLQNNEVVSHYCWLSEDSVLAFMRGNDNRERYYIIDVNTLGTQLFADGVLDSYGDGHPSFKDGIVITDTYPDKARNKNLIKISLENNKAEVIGSFFESFKFKNECRCDLHPRFVHSENNVSVDSVHEGRRFLYLVKMT